MLSIVEPFQPSRIDRSLVHCELTNSGGHENTESKNRIQVSVQVHEVQGALDRGRGS